MNLTFSVHVTLAIVGLITKMLRFQEDHMSGATFDELGK